MSPPPTEGPLRHSPFPSLHSNNQSTDMLSHPQPHPPKTLRKSSFMQKLKEHTINRPKSPANSSTASSAPSSPSLSPTEPAHQPAAAAAEGDATPVSATPKSASQPPPMATRKNSFRDLIAHKTKALSLGRSKSDHMMKKYGVCEKGCIGKGATAIVRLAHKMENRNAEKLYAIKEFRKRRKNESERDYVKKLTSEFCISSSLHHINVVETIDLIQDENQHWCEVMEYCPGGDLYSCIKNGKMTQDEIDCCFKQLVQGVSYLHSMGVAHRDLKPENLLLDAQGHLKITDFGVSEVFRMCWESEPHMSRGVCGSEPYIAPEEFSGGEYDAREVDVWACGVVYYAMTYQGIPWRHAAPDDPNYAYFLAHRKGGFDAIDKLPLGAQSLLNRILEPDPKKRITIPEILNDEWFKNIDVCYDCRDRNEEIHDGISGCGDVGSGSDAMNGTKKHTHVHHSLLQEKIERERSRESEKLKRLGKSGSSSGSLGSRKGVPKSNPASPILSPKMSPRMEPSVKKSPPSPPSRTPLANEVIPSIEVEEPSLSPKSSRPQSPASEQDSVIPPRTVSASSSAKLGQSNKSPKPDVSSQVPLVPDELRSTDGSVTAKTCLKDFKDFPLHGVQLPPSVIPSTSNAPLGSYAVNRPSSPSAGSESDSSTVELNNSPKLDPVRPSSTSPEAVPSATKKLQVPEQPNRSLSDSVIASSASTVKPSSSSLPQPQLSSSTTSSSSSTSASSPRLSDELARGNRNDGKKKLKELETAMRDFFHIH
ncbi:kinase-like domain-containing protein [Paraphysoderma sedebokerense]|nr:kinase-like domain-containing protein [Paraphysoderma sedebokerense]